MYAYIHSSTIATDADHTAASILRKDISASLYLLSAYYAIVHESIAIRVKNQGGDADTKGTHAYHLKKARESVFSKLLALLPALDTNSGFSKFQLRIGGRFPREEYDRYVSCHDTNHGC